MEFIKKLFLPITLPIRFIQNNFKAMLFLLLVVVLFAPTQESEFRKNNLQEIKLTGPIMDVTSILEQIQKAQNNKNIKGVLLNVNSPGGSVAPSIEIAYAIKRLNNIKPVVVYASGTIASGSYYASIWADKIFANPGSMVGSIGVVMEGANLSGLMKKLGVESQVIQAGKYKTVGTPTRKWKNYEVAELNKVIQSTYDMFTQDVANARKLDIKKRDSFANAHIFTASQAKEVGLIDEIGVSYDAKLYLAQKAGVKKPVWNKEDKLEKLLKNLSASTLVTLYTYFPEITIK